MALPQLTLPPGTPPFLLDGHQIEQNSLYGVSPMQAGHSRTRRVWTSSERFADVSLFLTADRMAAVHDWYEGPLFDGNGRFSAHVADDEGGIERALWWPAEFEAPPEYEPVGPSYWRMTARLRLTGQGQADGPYTGELAYAVSVALNGEAAGVVVPQIRYAVSIALQDQVQLGYSVTVPLAELARLLLEYDVTVALLQYVYVAPGCAPFTVYADTGQTYSANDAVVPINDTGETIESCEELT